MQKKIKCSETLQNDRYHYWQDYDGQEEVTCEEGGGSSEKEDLLESPTVSRRVSASSLSPVAFQARHRGRPKAHISGFVHVVVIRIHFYVSLEILKPYLASYRFWIKWFFFLWVNIYGPPCRRIHFGNLAIGHPSNGKTPGKTANLKVGYFWKGLIHHFWTGLTHHTTDWDGGRRPEHARHLTVTPTDVPTVTFRHVLHRRRTK